VLDGLVKEEIARRSWVTLPAEADLAWGTMIVT
jgi:hypothetical protein